MTHLSYAFFKSLTRHAAQDTCRSSQICPDQDLDQAEGGCSTLTPELKCTVKDAILSMSLLKS